MIKTIFLFVYFKLNFFFLPFYYVLSIFNAYNLFCFSLYSLFVFDQFTDQKQKCFVLKCFYVFC